MFIHMMCSPSVDVYKPRGERAWLKNSDWLAKLSQSTAAWKLAHGFNHGLHICHPTAITVKLMECLKSTIKPIFKSTLLNKHVYKFIIFFKFQIILQSLRNISRNLFSIYTIPGWTHLTKQHYIKETYKTWLTLRASLRSTPWFISMSQNWASVILSCNNTTEQLAHFHSLIKEVWKTKL